MKQVIDSPIELWKSYVLHQIVNSTLSTFYQGL